MNRSLLALATLLVLSACASRPESEPVAIEEEASSSQPSSASGEILEVFEYTNEEYDFTLQYPAHYDQLAPQADPFPRQYGMYIEDDVVMYEGEEYPLLSLASTDQEIPSELSFYVEVFPLQNFSYVNIYDDEYLYDAQADSWQKAMADVPVSPTKRTVGNAASYMFVFGDAGNHAQSFVIPHTEKDVIIKLTFGGCLGCIEGEMEISEERYAELQDHANADMEQILQSFKLMENEMEEEIER